MNQSLMCQITVKGNGIGKYGHSKTDRTGAVADFLVDNTVLYAAVRKHIRKCNVCDPRDALQEYLNRRIRNPKFKGMSSNGLVTQAVALNKICKQRNLPDMDDLVREMMWRQGSPHDLQAHMGFLGIEGLVRGLIFLKEKDLRERRLVHNKVAELCNTLSPLAETIKQLAVIVDNFYTVENPVPSKKELEEMLSVAEVMLTIDNMTGTDVDSFYDGNFISPVGSCRSEVDNLLSHAY